ncbi:response regulator [Leeuwenhoekiella sp. MAR_2009_132]|uniref:hybrid sensor histidine kinase/response regulator n=1 Tax=Leeuwenhoekiella sp. MAR_2009_132 TaxID=1392489 RepID=UPI00048E08CF|nr:response regulator [Leeuwenhoekiella sp. MAR_2009_132]
MKKKMFFDKRLVVIFLLFSLISFGQRPGNNENERNIKIDSLIIDAVNLIGASNFTESVKKLEEARYLAQKIDNKSRAATASQLLSNVYLKQGEFDKANIEIRDAIITHQELKETDQLGKDYLYYSQILIKTNDSQRALPFLEQAETILIGSRDKGVTDDLASAYLYHGNILQELKKPEEALPKYENALALLLDQKKKNYFVIARIYIQSSRAYESLLSTEKSLDYAKKAHELSISNNFPQIELDALALLSTIYSNSKDYEKAFTYLNTYNQKRQTYFGDNGSNTKALTIRNALLSEIDPADYNPARLVQANKITTVLIIALFTILCLLALSLYKNNNLRAKANELLQAKNAELIIAKENAEKASVVKAQFLSTITHELRTPMYAVTGLTHLLLSENPTAEQKKHLDSLKFSGEYLLSLINNILDLNKLEADKVEVEKATFNLRKRVDDVLFALERSAQEKGNKLILEYDNAIPEQIVGDPLMMSQILINLIGNGNKFTRDGSIFVRINQISKNETQTYLHFEIEDTGEGISKKKQKDIFQNFTQGSVQINRKFGGTGLGLSIVKRLLNLQKSKIELESTLGKGSKFFFDIKYALPLSKDKEPEERVYEIDYESLKGRKILVVEDNKINQMITRKILEKNFMECDVADNGEIAIEKVRFETYDLVLMDIHMPGISGIEATEKIREFNKDLPILALTAVTIDENIDDFYLAGFNDIIPKPYKIEEFFSKIHNALKRKNVIL